MLVLRVGSWPTLLHRVDYRQPNAVQQTQCAIYFLRLWTTEIRFLTRQVISTLLVQRNLRTHTDGNDDYIRPFVIDILLPDIAKIPGIIKAPDDSRMFGDATSYTRGSSSSAVLQSEYFCTPSRNFEERIKPLRFRRSLNTESESPTKMEIFEESVSITMGLLCRIFWGGGSFIINAWCLEGSNLVAVGRISQHPKPANSTPISRTSARALPCSPP